MAAGTAAGVENSLDAACVEMSLDAAGVENSLDESAGVAMSEFEMSCIKIIIEKFLNIDYN